MRPLETEARFGKELESTSGPQLVPSADTLGWPHVVSCSSTDNLALGDTSLIWKSLPM